MGKINSIAKNQVFSLLSFSAAVIFLVALVWVSSGDDEDIKINTYQELKEYAEEGKSFDLSYDVTKEPHEKIMDGVLRYNTTLTSLLVKENSIIAVSKKVDQKGRKKIVLRTFYPNGDVDFDIKIFDIKGQRLVEHFQRKGKLNRSVFLETASSKIKI